MQYPSVWSSPFTVLTKGTFNEVNKYIKRSALLAARKYQITQRSAQKLLELSESEPQKLLFGINKDVGYPITYIIDSLAFLYGAEMNMLKGKRPIGNRESLIRKYLRSDPDAKVEFYLPDLLSEIK